ncbi:hypothetical protein VN0229_13980 [Helicobacter pylori]|nr:hypothetical protein VN0229_13980 [Helicobacter pylori]
MKQHPLKTPKSRFSQCGKGYKVFGRVALLYKQASLTQATRKESKRVSTLAQPPSKDTPMNTLFLMVFILYPFILEFLIT